MYLPAANGVPSVIGPNIATDLKTDFSAWNVVETLAVHRADLHVFDRLGLDGKIGSLRPRHGDKPCRGAEEKTLHLHSNLHCASWKCSVQPRCGMSEWSPIETKRRPGFCFPGKACDACPQCLPQSGLLTMAGTSDSAVVSD